MKSKYKIRHEILCYLFKKVTYTDIDVPILNSSKSSLKEIAEGIKYPYKDVVTAHHGLPDSDVKCMTDMTGHYMILVRDGFSAVIDEYWLREGQKELNERIYEKTKWVVPIIALIITAGSLIYSAHKIVRTEEKIKSVEMELQELKEQKNLPSYNPTFSKKNKTAILRDTTPRGTRL